MQQKAEKYHGGSFKSQKNGGTDESPLKTHTYNHSLGPSKFKEGAVTFPIFPKIVNNWIASPIAFGNSCFISNGIKYCRFKKADREEKAMSEIVNPEKVLEDEKRCVSEGIIRLEPNIGYTPDQKEEQLKMMYMYNSAGVGNWGKVEEQNSALERASVKSGEHHRINKGKYRSESP